MDDKLVINLLIGKQVHAITVPRDMEETFRAAAKMINEKLNRYEQKFPSMGSEKYMSIVMLDLAVSVLQQEDKQATRPFNDCMEQLTKEIEELSFDS